MALIECYECGREISSLAPHCINCGAPRKAQRKKKAPKSKTVFVDLTERQLEQLENIGAIPSKKTAKKKTVKKVPQKKTATKNPNLDDIGGHKSSYKSHHFDVDKRRGLKPVRKKKTVNKASPKKSVQTPAEAGQAFVKPFKSYQRTHPLQLTWFLWFFVVGIIVFILLAATGLSLVLPGWAIGLVIGIAGVIYTIIRGEDPRGVKIDGQLGELSEELRSGDFGLWLCVAIIIGFVILMIFALAS